jgi:adenylosuccinate lyase
MIPRYSNAKITGIWSDEGKLGLWQKTELAVIEARARLGLVPAGVHSEIRKILEATPIDLAWWHTREKDTNHDLQAFLDERLRHLPPELQSHFHLNMTSYDTEEPAFAGMLKASVELVQEQMRTLESIITVLAQRYAYTPMMGVTHGQWAELQTFGKRCLTWLRLVLFDFKNLSAAAQNLNYSKLSGAIGNYGSMEPAVEREALRILGFEPFIGATQITPRNVYAPLGEALYQIVMDLHKISLDIRLGARSGLPIYQEPFGKKQTGSSAMPHKKNTIATEQLEGMARIAGGYLSMIMNNIATWEERAIEQSSVERIAWPDMFHTVLQPLKSIIKVLSGLRVYPDNMMQQIVDSRGTYASGDAKEFLRQNGIRVGLSTEDAYRIVQLAAFNAFEVSPDRKALREHPFMTFEAAEKIFSQLRAQPPTLLSIKDIISRAKLRTSSELAATEADVDRWNQALIKLFSIDGVDDQWDNVFSFQRILAGERTIYEELLGAMPEPRI